MYSDGTFSLGKNSENSLELAVPTPKVSHKVVQPTITHENSYSYLVLSSQASTRSRIICNTMSALTAQRAFLNNFENVFNRRVNIWEDIKQYQKTLSYTSSKVDYSIRENIYMLPSNMNLNIRSGTVGYNNKILVSDGTFSLGKNSENSLELAVPTPKVSHKVVQPSLKKTQHRNKLSLMKRKKLP